MVGAGNRLGLFYLVELGYFFTVGKKLWKMCQSGNAFWRSFASAYYWYAATFGATFVIVAALFAVAVPVGLP